MQVKAGDLAIQVKSYAANEGKIVEVIKFIGNDPFFNGAYWLRGEGPCWMARYKNKAMVNDGTYVLESPIPDAWLRPVSGLPMDEEVPDQIKEPA